MKHLGQAREVLGVGIHDGIHEDVYHADPAPEPSLSNSLITTLASGTPRHAWCQHPRLNPRYESKESSGFDLGTTVHALLLEGRDNVHVVDADSWRTNAAKAEYAKARAAGRVPLLAADHLRATDMLDAALDFIAAAPMLSGVLDDGHTEQTVIWQDGETWCRARLDLLRADYGLIVDYKTTSLRDPGAWVRRSAIEHGYDTQSVWYRKAVAAFGHRRPEFVFLVQETRSPYLCYLIEPTESMNELGSLKIARAMRTWRQCIAADSWPGYPTAPFLVDAPSWAMREELI